MPGALNIDKNKKLITHFACNLRDESFKPIYFIIGQYLSNTNESATVPETKKNYQLNTAEYVTY